MCYESLITGEAAERPVTRLLRGEFGSAVNDGAVAALVVAAVLALQGTAPWLVLAAAAGALVLGVFVHQFVLLVGIGLVRLRADAGTGSAATETVS